MVRSTSLKTEDLIILRKKISILFADLEESYHGFWARIVRGDEIECVVPEYEDTLRIAISIKLFIKMCVSNMECSHRLRRYGIRFSIGVSDELYANRREDIINGPAIYISGRNLDAISHKGETMSAFEVEGASKDVNDLMDSYVAMVSSLVDSYSSKQAEVVYYKLMGWRERDIGDRLGIYQSSVNMRAAGAQWRLLKTAIANFENYCL